MVRERFKCVWDMAVLVHGRLRIRAVNEPELHIAVCLTDAKCLVPFERTGRMLGALRSVFLQPSPG